jgi:hypothetical protein
MGLKVLNNAVVARLSEAAAAAFATAVVVDPFARPVELTRAARPMAYPRHWCTKGVNEADDDGRTSREQVEEESGLSIRKPEEDAMEKE